MAPRSRWAWAARSPPARSRSTCAGSCERGRDDPILFGEVTMAVTDPFAQFKAAQREGWAFFAPLEMSTTRPAAALVRFAGISPGQAVLDVACGTGVVAVTAARVGAR